VTFLLLMFPLPPSALLFPLSPCTHPPSGPPPLLLSSPPSPQGSRSLRAPTSGEARKYSRETPGTGGTQSQAPANTYPAPTAATTLVGVMLGVDRQRTFYNTEPPFPSPHHPLPPSRPCGNLLCATTTRLIARQQPLTWSESRPTEISGPPAPARTVLFSSYSKLVN